MSNLKTMVRGAYDLQKLRIQMGNRIVGNFKAKLGQKPSEKEQELDSEGKKILADMRVSYRKIADGVKSFPRQATFKGDEVISSYTELCLIAQYVELESSERSHFRRLVSVLQEYPIYNEFLEGVRGVGPAMAGVIISEIDITRARYASSLWRYAGLDVGKDGKGRSRRAEHLIDVEYEAADGETMTRKSITFNPFLKTKLIGVLGPSFLKSNNALYRDIYDDYRHRLKNHDNHKEKSDGWHHNMAIRYIIKMFLVDLYTTWRKLEDLSASKTYHEEKLGHGHLV